MLWPPAQAKVYNVALTIEIFPLSGPRSEKVGHPCSNIMIDFLPSSIQRMFMTTNSSFIKQKVTDYEFLITLYVSNYKI